jgi:proline iminopeptidase
MNRRTFLQSSAALAAVSIGLPAIDAQESSPSAEAINPQGIRTAGIRMIPVVNGKYNVWTKRVGSGKIKVLLLHGGPAFTHNYL